MSDSNIINCVLPHLPDNASTFELLQWMGEMQAYRLCQIQSAENHMKILATELAKSSVAAGIMARTMVRSFKDLEMTYLEDSRRELRVQGEKITETDLPKSMKV